MQKNSSIYFLGIGGTFVGSVAVLARELGYRVGGVDQAIYPPMSNQLADLGIEFDEGYANHSLGAREYQQVIVGNAISRGNPALEYLLDEGLPFCSAPEWMAKHLLGQRHVLAVSGTHGKTTTSSMLAWILECAGLSPGFLIGGVPENFPTSARLGTGKYFVIEADEYDSAFCDKRSKFVHYRPRTLVINNLEFDHADIFSDLASIQTQFHHLIRTLPQSADIFLHRSSALDEVIDQGCWSQLHYLSGEGSCWHVQTEHAGLQSFSIHKQEPAGVGQAEQGSIEWSLAGRHNVDNAVAAVAAARSVGVPVAEACRYLSGFKSVKRRMQHIATVNQVDVFDDFAHHPTAIQLTLEGAKLRYPDRRIVAVIEAASNTMRSGVHHEQLPQAVAAADSVWWYQGKASNPDLPLPEFDTERVVIMSSIDSLIESITGSCKAGDLIIIMSNGGFGGIHGRLVSSLEAA